MTIRYLFYLNHQYSIPVIKPLVNYLLEKEPQHPFRFKVSRKVERTFPEEWDPDFILRSRHEIERFAPDFTLSAENYIDYRIPGYKVQIFHGIGVEKRAHFKIRHFYDIYLTSGPYVTDRYRQMEKELGYFRVIETGWPKIDHILSFENGHSIQSFEKKGIDHIILYAPTFSRKMQSANILAEYIFNEMKENELWLIKFHELMDPAIKNLFADVKKNNLIILPDSDISPFLHMADILVSDTSSVIYEFLTLDKPVITYQTKGNLEKGFDILKPEELRPALDLLLNSPDYNRETRTKMLMKVNPYLDGMIAERVFLALKHIYLSGLDTKKSKPINLFRKMKVLCGRF